MALNDTLANTMSKLLNCEKMSKKSFNTSSSNLIKEVLLILKKGKYITDFKTTKTTKGENIEVELTGKINNCGVIKPRFSVKKGEYEKFEKRYLPAKGFGVILVSTPSGLMTHTDAISKGFGGKLIAYCY